MVKLYINYTNQSLNRFSFKFKKLDATDKIVDFRGSELTPVEAYYLSKGSPFIMNIPVEKCKFIEFSGLNPSNPFVQTLIEYGRGICTSYINSPLEDFYSNWQPKQSILHFHEGVELAPPWDKGMKKTTNLADGRLRRKDFVRIKKSLGISDSDISGHINRGAVSRGFGEITFNRLVKIYNSIRRHGYNPEKMNSDHIRASFFLHNDDYRASIGCGKHRVAALQALGFTEIPILFGPPLCPAIIRREDVAMWPNVRAGYYTEKVALQIFDAKFLHEHPSKWQWHPDFVSQEENLRSSVL